MVRGLVSGAIYPFRAIAVFWQTPKLLTFLILPIFVNFIIGVGLYLSLLLPGLRGVEQLTLQVTQWVNNAIATLPTWLGFLDNLILVLGYLFQGLILILLLLITGFLLLQFGSILGSPWYGLLSEKLEEQRLGQATTIDIGIIRDIWRALLFELKKLVFWLGLAIPLLILGFIPGVGPLFLTLCWVSLTAFIACLDFLDGPSERRRFPFRKKVQIVLMTLPASASFSLVCWFLCSIPLFNLLTIPLCVSAGTLFWCDRVYPKVQ
ncbi:EI24 domain-containing protein [Spirulina subsalsa]|uniref:EI24 domain-containing protein n=1 Tax=Spirulina subsalsa TaxID=54311 RepID=UPI00031E1440|nr:EI24 domain-containing protein [Spirulina subsalsa]